MKKTKRLICFIVLLLFITCGMVGVKAWTAPTVKEAYVEPEVELRSVWICTVSNMDVKKQSGTSQTAINEWKNQYLTILQNCVDLGMNAVIFQVRPCNDAFYPSKYNPWSEYLAGFGVDPGWDPLEWMIGVTHAAGLEYHAWLNPYRASTQALSFSITEKDKTTGSSKVYDYDKTEAANYKASFFGDLRQQCVDNNTLVDNPIFATGEKLQHNVVYGTEGKFVLNPAAEETITHLNNTITELITNYELDGIHFDDYFYPSNAGYNGKQYATEYKNLPFSTEPDVDQADYNAFKLTGAAIEGDEDMPAELYNSFSDNIKHVREVENWRRQNVSNLIKGLSEIIREHNATVARKCAFGISPAARWAPNVEYCSIRGAVGGMGLSGDCNNYYSYSDLYADIKRWIDNGYLDYILPQIYTYLGSAQGGYPTNYYGSLVEWWYKALIGTNCKLYIGTPAYQINTWSQQGLSAIQELYWQVRWNQHKKYVTDGYVMFRYASIIEGAGNGAKAMDLVKKQLWKIYALTPIYDSYTYNPVSDYAKINKIKKNSDGTYGVYFDKINDAKAYGILEDDKLIARVSSAASQVNFNYLDDTHTYKLVTYGYDNNMHASSDVVDMSKVVEDKKPEITFKTTLDDKYVISTNVKLEFEITNPEDRELKYTLIFKTSDRDYTIDSKKKITNLNLTISFDMYAIEMNNCYFVLSVDDGYAIVEYETSKFNIVERIDDPTPPTPPIEGGGEDDNPPVGPSENTEPVKPQKKKCGKKSLELFISLISVVGVFSLILRKRR